MKNILLVMQNVIRQNKYAFLVAIACAIGLVAGAFLYTQGSGEIKRISIGIVDEDQSKISKEITDSLKQIEALELVEGTMTGLAEALAQNDIYFILKITKGTENKLFKEKELKNLEFYAGNDFKNEPIVRTYLMTLTNQIGILAKVSDSEEMFWRLYKDYKQSAMFVSYEPLKKITESTINIRPFMGLYTQITLMLSYLFTVHLLGEKRSKTWNRMKIAPISGVAFIGGISLFGLLVNMINIGIYLIINQLMGINLGIKPLQTGGIMLVFAMVGVAINLLIGLLCNNTNTALMGIMGVSVSGPISSGAYFPESLKLPDFLQVFSYFTPHKWFVESFTLMREGESVAFQVGVLMLFFIVISLISIYKFVRIQKEGV